MRKADYHIHSDFSFDGKNTMREMAGEAFRQGFSEIAFTDHADFHPSYPPLRDFRERRAVLSELKEEYRGRLTIADGVEIGLEPRLAGFLKGFVAEHGFGFVIGSLHDMDGADIYGADIYKGKDKDEVYGLFLDYMLRCVKCADFDVLGHFDYVERYVLRHGGYENGSLDPEVHRGIIDEILKTLVSDGRGLEVNSSGFFYWLNHPHPDVSILKRFRELGGEIVTIGSDAHRVDRLGRYYSETVQTLKDAGFGHCAVYRERKPVFIKL